MQETLADIGDLLAMFSPNFMADGREFHEEHERDWGGATTQAAQG